MAGELLGAPAQEMADGLAAAAVEFQAGHTRDDIAVVVAFLDEVGNCPPPESEDDDLDGEFVENENGKET